MADEASEENKVNGEAPVHPDSIDTVPPLLPSHPSTLSSLLSTAVAMPDYNTRLRTNVQILPPRRLRQDDSPIKPPAYHRAKPSLSQPPPPLSQFSLPNLQSYADDANNKTFIAINQALLALENRAVTIKDLSFLVMKHGLVCQNASAASQAITTFIRNHLNRCRQDHLLPLLLSVPLTGTDADDRLAPALHSRSGGTSASARPSTDSALTKFRRGTTVWYLSEASGAVCPFKKAGLPINDIVNSPSQKGTKRKRDSQSSTQLKKIHASPSPASSSTSSCQGNFQSFPRLELTLKLRARSSSSSDSELEHSTSEAEDNDGGNNASRSRSPSYVLSTDPLSFEDGSDDSDDSAELESSTNDIHDELEVFSSPNSEIYPSSLQISSLSKPVQCNDAYPFYFTQNLCSTHFIKSTWSTFRTALPNPYNPSRAKSISPSPFTPSPPPDSEDEDDDFHNSMIGLHRGNMSVPVEIEDDPKLPKFEPVSPKFVPGSAHLARKTPEFEDLFEKRPESPEFESASTPLETLPGFVLEPESTDAGASIKAEDPMITLSSSSYRRQGGYERLDHVKRDVSPSPHLYDDPIRTDVVHDVEVLGPETVPSPEWDIAWSQFDDRAVDRMDVDCGLSSPPELNQGQTRPSVTCESTAPSCPEVPIDIRPSAVAIPTLSCNPAIIALVIDNISLYCTMLGPDMPFVRRIDNDSINITQVHRFLELPPEWLLIDVPEPCLSMSAAGLLQGTWVSLDVAKVIVRQLQDRIPADVLNIFLSSDLGRHFPNYGKTPADDSMKPGGDDEKCIPPDVILLEDEGSDSSPKDICIRVEDLFELVDSIDNTTTHEKDFKSEPWSSIGSLSRPTSLYPDGPMAAGSKVLGSGEENVPSLNQQEEELFHSLLDLDDGATSWNQHVLVKAERCSSLAGRSNNDSGSQGSTATASPNRGQARRKGSVQPVRRSSRVASKVFNDASTSKIKMK